MKIGILTGGGDVPGLNSAIKAVVFRAMENKFDVLGFRRGWGGVLEVNPDDPESVAKHTCVLNRNVVRTVDRTGGTFLHSSRTHPGRVKPSAVPEMLKSTAEYQEHQGDGPIDFTGRVLRNLEKLGVDRLIPIGGDDTIGYGERLHREGFPVIVIPKTMDNDVYGTDYCIGFGTAVTRSVEFIHQLRTSTGSHERIAVVELFGRNSGETALITSYLSGVDRCLISEVPFDPQKLAELILRDKRQNPSNYAMVAVSEGARMIGGDAVQTGAADPYGHKKLGGVGVLMGEILRQLTGEGIVYQQLGYLMRSGQPDALDLMVSVNFGNMAMDLIEQKLSGRMCALRDGTYTHIPMSEISEGVRRVDVDELYDVETYRPKVQHVLGKPMFLY